MMRRAIFPVSLVGLTLMLAACSSTRADSATGSNPSSPSASTTQSSTSPAPTTPAPSPVTSSAPCPYLATQDVMAEIGQHIARTTVTRGTGGPLPSCAFYRPDGRLAAKVTTSTESSAAEAQQQSLKTVGNGPNPAKVGDYGVVSVNDDGAVLATTKGNSLVVVTINQQSSLEATELATAVVAKL